ncbi:hypothetical protein [Kitasatospora sp. GP82]|uniref:hypothetical protein n=1 Tax=Kitasatospora sp. GP82 TaxID=3035089 RepID=UPI0024741B13|nr:hypothetical protein [Kitasatospora sp. GP82]MDH6124792.1 hypothetical protein [Kitasatospora sp. GP82]
MAQLTGDEPRSADAAVAVRELGTGGRPLSAECRRIAEAMGAAMGGGAWVFPKSSGWRIYCRYRGPGPDRQQMAELNAALDGASRWGSRCSWNEHTVRATVWAEVPAPARTVTPARTQRS